MKKNLLTVYSIIILFAMACSSPTPEFDDTLPEVRPTEAPVSIQPDNTLSETSSPGDVALNPPHGEPGHDCNIEVGAPLNGTVNPVNITSPVLQGAGGPLNNSVPAGVRLNPPHGEPGHDCNIQVGQPLS